jgi:IS5 family transposase
MKWPGRTTGRKSRVRAKVEHVFQVMKLKFRFVKVRYRGLKKNAHVAIT